jgi:hypothetical protein
VMAQAYELDDGSILASVECLTADGFINSFFFNIPSAAKVSKQADIGSWSVKPRMSVLPRPTPSTVHLPSERQSDVCRVPKFYKFLNRGRSCERGYS